MTKKQPATTKRLVTDVSTDLHERVHKRAIEDRKSMKKWVTEAITSKLNGATGALSQSTNLTPGERILVEQYINFLQKCPPGLRKASLGLQRCIEDLHRESRK